MASIYPEVGSIETGPMRVAHVLDVLTLRTYVKPISYLPKHLLAERCQLCLLEKTLCIFDTASPETMFTD